MPVTSSSLELIDLADLANLKQKNQLNDRYTCDRRGFHSNGKEKEKQI